MALDSEVVLEAKDKSAFDDPGARRLNQETNHVLGAAIRVYESVGSRHVPAERVVKSPYVRSDVSMELSPEGYSTPDAGFASK
jgi:hypothetical protein